MNENIEIANCEFTDDHDFAFLRHVKNLRFHHNFVENFNDDGLECGPKLRDHTIYITQNRIGGCLIPLTQHELSKDDSPPDHDPLSGVFISRNVIDLRGGTYKGPPAEADPTGAFVREEGHLCGDHGGPVWAVYRFYHNTVLRETPVFRDYFLMGLGAQGLRHNERDVFNNIFVQSDKVPGVGFAGITEAGNVREGGNLLWGLTEGPLLKADKDTVVACSVRAGKIDFMVGGKAIGSFKGDFARLSVPEAHRLPNAKALFLMVWGPKTSFQFDRIVVTPVRGKGTILK